jgi:3-hydroxyisobutyrate dehydrogenase-like beta-hydroxyacid dehydrogenase
VPAAYLKEIQSKLRERKRFDIHLLDSPVSGGTVRAANGALTILVSGSSAALRKGNRILTDLSEKLFVIPGGVGAASNVKMINQLLAGVHIAAAAEAMGLAARMGLNTRIVYERILTGEKGKGDGWSWMFENRVPHMLENDWHPHSALDIFVKDMVSHYNAALNMNLVF